MRLIDANELKEAISTTPYNDYDDLTRTEKLIDNAPTVEPERPMFNRAELEKALDYWYNNQEVGNEEQNEMVWCAINAIKYCIEHSSDYQE